jgi:hypothetical protein
MPEIHETNKARREERAAKAGGTKSGKKRKDTTDLTEEEMPVSSGGPRPRFELLLEAQKNVGRLEAKELALAEEKATFYKRALWVMPRGMPRGSWG